MPQKQLREQLARLHEELEATDAMDADDRQLLLQLMDDIGEALDRTASTEAASDEAPEAVLTERVTSAVTRLDQDHPTVSFTLRRVVDLLGRMGI